jgi:NAD(P)-dependent dehydrogenase (short-subunit alcohol dehydrogenase family)
VQLGRRFEGRVAVITGASRGIGLGVAERLVAEGARVCLTARNEGPLRDAVERLGGKEVAIAVAGRADDVEHQRAAVSAAVEAFGGLDVLVNNTGINPVAGDVIDADPVAIMKTFGVNVVAALGWARVARDAGLGSQSGAAIVNMASIAGLRAAPPIGVYGASKAALVYLTGQLAVELAPRIRVNAVAPGIVKTQFATPLYQGREDQVAAGYPLRRLGVPPDIAAAVAFLAGHDASWITGQTIVVDGGVSLVGGVG